MNWLNEHWLQLLFMAGYLAMLAHHCWAGNLAACFARRRHAWARK